jgi:hypothetical protein
MPEIPLPTTLRRSIKNVVFALVASLLGFFASFLMVDHIVRYWWAGLSVLAIIVSVLQLHPKAAYLRLTAEGFTYCALFRKFSFLWNDISKFGVAVVSDREMVGWNFAEHYTRSRRGRALSTRLSGYESALPDTYGMTAKDLASLMETLRQVAHGEIDTSEEQGEDLGSPSRFYPF